MFMAQNSAWIAECDAYKTFIFNGFSIYAPDLLAQKNHWMRVLAHKYRSVPRRSGLGAAHLAKIPL
jgi:hypothetical protein